MPIERINIVGKKSFHLKNSFNFEFFRLAKYPLDTSMIGVVLRLWDF